MICLPAFTQSPERNRIYNADALSLLKALKTGSVSSVITDPPYGAKIADWDSDIPPQVILDECLRVSSGPVVWFGGRTPGDISKCLDYRPRPDRILIWNVTYSLTNVSDQGIRYKWHPIYCWRLPKQTVIVRDVLSYPTARRIPGIDHPAKKPLELMLKLVSAFGGDLICDPYAGSGTTLLAAQKLGRGFIGGDTSPQYVGQTMTRLSEPYTLNLWSHEV